ncbi:MAG TPA: nicotinamide-nucleotide amidohydrolase family protein, partial [Castellaniella sp.]|nr:nicotinamide-nucleotide amidohydrolase family protein [Castellaniella sp.]
MSIRELETLAGELGAALRASSWMCACAESCTGGLLAAALTTRPGSSAWFDRGFVTYSNAAKVEQLCVGTDTLERFGAVSEETAMEMASGVLAAARGAHLALSTTGIA